MLGCFRGVSVEEKRKGFVAELKQLYEAILKGDAGLAESVVREGLDQGVDPEKLVYEHMVPAMDEVGRRFENNEYFVPELLISARAMKAALAIIQPMLVSRGAKPAGSVVIGTVAGDLHDIGKNLVAAIMEGGGFRIHDLGVDVSVDKFLGAVKEHQPDIVALSALLTTTMSVMKGVVEALQENGLRDRVKVLIGGAPVTQQFAEEIGADGYSDNAAGALREARGWVSG
jgi:5-methyltetrahydrofolate--homocysteine methyltransferase